MASKRSSTHTPTLVSSSDAKKLDQGRGLFFQLASACLFFLPAAVPANIQQINGTSGSPGATLSVNGEVLPLAALPFGNEIRQVE
jgi:hypothetical protein